jgi:hypothetical protein
MTRGYTFRRCPILGLALVERLSIHLPLQLNSAIDQHVSSRKALLRLKGLPKWLRRATSLVPELLEGIAIRINRAPGPLCFAPFRETLDGTNNACERSIGWWIKERYRSMRGYKVPENALRVSRLLAWCGNFLNAGGADLAVLLQ